MRFFARGGLRHSRVKAASSWLGTSERYSSGNPQRTSYGSIAWLRSSRTMPAMPLPARKRERTSTSAKRASSRYPTDSARAIAASASFEANPSCSNRLRVSQTDRSRTFTSRSIFLKAAFCSSDSRRCDTCFFRFKEEDACGRRSASVSISMYTMEATLWGPLRKRFQQVPSRRLKAGRTRREPCSRSRCGCQGFPSGYAWRLRGPALSAHRHS